MVEIACIIQVAMEIFLAGNVDKNTSVHMAEHVTFEQIRYSLLVL